MPIVHFLNVDDGDCSIIEHISGHTTVIDVCNATPATQASVAYEVKLRQLAANEKGTNGNFSQKSYPTNPVLYMLERDIKKVFRFILTHPDLDHMDGIESFFNTFTPTNFWDTANRDEKKDWNKGAHKYNESDWRFYKSLRDGKRQNAPTRLTLYSGAENQYFNTDGNGKPGGDGLYILAPTPTLMAAANECGDYNDCSYVILYKSCAHRILFAGDSHDETWKHILKYHKADVKDVDLLIAPHHGRDSGRDWEFLSEVNPALTLLGNAPAKHLGYQAWTNRGLKYITNNQAGSVIVNVGVEPMDVFVTCRAFAEKENSYNAVYADWAKGYYWGKIKRRVAYTR